MLSCRVFEPLAPLLAQQCVLQKVPFSIPKRRQVDACRERTTRLLCFL